MFSTQAVLADSASLSVGLSSSSISVDGNVTVSVRVSSGGQAINAAEGALNFSTEYLESQGTSVSGSIFSFWTSSPSVSGGNVNFGGGVPSPGYNGSGGKIFDVTFKAKKSGTTSFSISGGKVLANDGLGTDIFGGSSGATLTINEKSVSGGESAPAEAAPVSRALRLSAPTISSSTHPDQGKWYKEKTVKISWTRPSGSSGVSYSWDQSEGAKIDDRLEGRETSKEFKVSADGVYWFHTKAKYDSGFSSQANFKVQVDSTPPEPFTVSIEQEGGLTNPRPKLKFEAKDAVSGIDRYEIKIDNGLFGKVETPVTLDKQMPGRHAVIARAYDKAGNFTEASAEFRVQGLPAPRLSLKSRYIAVFQPLEMEFVAPEDWKIIFYVDDEEKARFATKEQKRIARRYVVFGAEKSEMGIYEYAFDSFLKPGKHSTYIVGIDPQGNYSEPSEKIYFSVLTSVIQIGRYAFSAYLVLAVMLGIFGLMSVLMAFLVIRTRRKIRQWLAVYRRRTKTAAEKVVKEVDKLEKKVEDKLPSEDANKISKEIKKTKKEIEDELKPFE